MDICMFTIMRKYVLPVLLSLIQVACEQGTETSDIITGKYIAVDMGVEMSIAGFENREQTRASGILPGDIGNEENTIHNITVFQFDGEGGDADPLVVLRYVDSDLNNLVLGLMQPKSDPTRKQFLYLVANAGTQLQDFTGTYGELKQKLIPVNDAGIADGNMIMTASLSTEVSSLITIPIKFLRRLAKINVTYSIAADVNFTPARLQLRVVPKSFALEDISDPRPSASADNFYNYISITDNISNGHTWYMPENLRGIGNASDAKNKIASTAPSGQEDFCTYVELSGLYQRDGVSQLVSYRVYLGGNNTTDYNVEANRIYNVNLSVKGINDADKRITVETLPDARKPANCYMVVPGTTVVIDMLKLPGTEVSDNEVDYATRVGAASTNTNNIKSIGMLWQTEKTPDGLIQDLTYLSATGQAMFKVTPGASGNLLLAAYSDTEQKGTVLWSWHIWITDYCPDEYVIGNTSVTGGDVYYSSRDGGTWMDRDLGALTATKGASTTIGYAYQWGRKDPFPLSNAIDAMVQRPLYDSKGAYLRSGAATEVHNSGENGLIENAVAHPWIFFTTTEDDGSMLTGHWWKTSTEFALWSDTEKTMYDPCPAGWRLPSSTIVGKMWGAELSRQISLKGGSYGSLWYQYCGYMSYKDGTIGEPGGTSVYWSSKLYIMYQLGGTVGHNSRHGGFGFIGRCVKQE